MSARLLSKFRKKKNANSEVCDVGDQLGKVLTS